MKTIETGKAKNMEFVISAKTKIAAQRKINRISRCSVFGGWERIDDLKSKFHSRISCN